MDRQEFEPFSDPERMRSGIKSIRGRERTMLIDCADRPRLVTFDAMTNLVLRSTPVIGRHFERPAEDIPIGGTGEVWNPDDDPLPEAA